MTSRTSRYLLRQVYRKGYKGWERPMARQDRQELSEKLRQTLGKPRVRVKRLEGWRKKGRPNGR